MKCAGCWGSTGQPIYKWKSHGNSRYDDLNELIAEKVEKIHAKPPDMGNRPVAFEYGDHNDNRIVFNTFDKALLANPGAKRIFHSDRGYQYTSKTFRQKIVDAGMPQSMSRVGRCIDNGPMEGFWGIMKREMYYGRKYKTKETLIKTIEDYIDYYTNKRVQRNLGVVTPMEFYKKKLQQMPL